MHLISVVVLISALCNAVEGGEGEGWGQSVGEAVDVRDGDDAGCVVDLSWSVCIICEEGNGEAHQVP